MKISFQVWKENRLRIKPLEGFKQQLQKYIPFSSGFVLSWRTAWTGWFKTTCVEFKFSSPGTVLPASRTWISWDSWTFDMVVIIWDSDSGTLLFNSWAWVSSFSASLYFPKFWYVRAFSRFAMEGKMSTWSIVQWTIKLPQWA